jgi:hypothetical protein
VLRILLKIFKLRHGQSHVMLVEPAEIPADFHELLRILVRERPQQGGIDDAEDGRISPNPKSQREEGNHSEAGVLP